MRWKRHSWLLFISFGLDDYLRTSCYQCNSYTGELKWGTYNAILLFCSRSSSLYVVNAFGSHLLAIKLKYLCSADAFDTEQLVDCLEKLKSGQSYNVPIYDFKTHRRSSDSFRQVLLAVFNWCTL